MSKKLRGISIIAIICIIAATMVYSSMASSVNLMYDFENKSFSWTPLYENATATFETEENRNTYLRLAYNGEANRDRTYYDVMATSNAQIRNTIQADFDIKYSETAGTQRNGEIQFKTRTGPGKEETTLSARLAKIGSYFQIQEGVDGFQRVKGTDGVYLSIDVERWYSIKIVVNLTDNWQSVYIFDRETQQLLGLKEYFSTISDLKSINMITFTCGTDMCLDNVKIYAPKCESVAINGQPYLSKASRYPYYFFGKDYNGNLTCAENGTTTWSLENEKRGVSIDSQTGVLRTASAVDPGVVIIKAVRETESGEKLEAKYIVNVSN